MFGHAIQYGSGAEFLGNSEFFDNLLFKIIYSFHMPLFALISGYLFFWSMKKPVKTVIKKKITSLLIPILVWVTAEYILRFVKSLIENDFSIMQFVLDYLKGILHAFWFLWAMLWCSIGVIVVEKLLKGKVYAYALVIILLLFVPTKLNSHMYIYMYPYFVGGYLFNKYRAKDIYDRVVEKDWYVLTVSVIAFAVLLIFYNRDSYVYTTAIFVFGGKQFPTQLGIDIYRYIIGLVGSVVVILICKMICDNRQGIGVRLFAYFGQISLGIYILNSYVNSYVLSRITESFSPSVWIWLLETLISMPVYCILICVIKKIPYGNKLLLGGRK